MTDRLDVESCPPPVGAPFPAADSAPVRRLSAAWLLPLLAMAFAIYTGWRAWAERGPRISVEVRDGHGIRAGDPLRYRGIQVGEIEELTLSHDLARVRLVVRLLPEAAALAREGTRFWLVRPELSLEGVRGLETLLGANYLAVLPGPQDAPRAREFAALDVPPIGEELDADGLFLVLEAPTRFGLAPGAPITYREFQVGTVTAVSLASDATAVVVDAYVRPDYRQLVREDSRFWETGGVELELALTQGLHVDIGSLRSLLVGGIAFATPTQPGRQVESGQRFTLHADPEEPWIAWRPSIPIGGVSTVPTELPRPLPASITWRPRRILGREQQRTGWMLRLGESAIGPRDLVDPGEEVRDGELAITIAGQPIEPGDLTIEGSGDLARVPLALGAAPGFPRERVEFDARAGDWLVAGAESEPPLAISASRLVEDGDGWRVLGDGGFTSRWHGAAVVDRERGRLVGILLVGDAQVRIARLPIAWVEPR